MENEIARCPWCKIFRIDHFRTRWTDENVLRLYLGDVAAEDSIKFSTTVVVAKTSSTQAAGTRPRLATRHTYTPPSCPFLSLPPSLSLSLPCLRSRINYARYLHTKRPGKIKNTNSEREAPRGPVSSVPSSPSLASLRSRCTFSRRSELSPALSSSRVSLHPTSFGHIPAVAFPEAVPTLSHYSAGPPIL